MKKILLALLPLFTSSAFALELDFYTYNGFEETVSAFQRLALIVSDSDYEVFVGIFATASVMFVGISSGFKGFTGEGTDPLKAFIPIFVGLALYLGLMVPKGSIHVYDPTRNAYEEVAGVPDLVVLLAGTLSKVEQGMIGVVDTASANPYGDSAGAINYSLLKSALDADVNDIYLEKSLSLYFLDCGMPAMAESTTGARQRLHHNSTDLIDNFEEWKNKALSVVYYPPNNDAGEIRSCEDAWEGTGGLKERLTDATTYSSYKQSVCTTAGFNVADAAQLTKCESALVDTTSLFGVTQGSEVPLLRSIVLAQAVSNATNSADFSRGQRTLVDRQVMAEGFGSAEALNQWVPKVRAFLTAVMLGVIPLVALFLVTPMMKAAIMLIVGLFSWLTLWGICDAVATQMAFDAASDAFDQIRQQRLGIEAILHSPEAAVQALGVYGKSRTVAITLATVLSAALFKFGGYAFARLGEQWQTHIEQAGESAGRQTMLPEEQANFQRNLANALGIQAGLGQHGFMPTAIGVGGNDIRAGGEGNEYISNAISGGSSVGAQLSAEGANTANARIGDVRGINEAAATLGTSTASVVQDSSHYSSASSTASNVTSKGIDEELVGSSSRGGVEMGVSRSGDVNAQSEVNRKVGTWGDGTAAGTARDVGLQKNAAAIGEAEARSAEETISSRRFDSLVNKGSIDYAEEHRGAGTAYPESLGATDQAHRMAQNEATGEVLAEGGQELVSDIEIMNRSQQMGAVDTYSTGDGLRDNARGVGQTTAAGQIAQSENLSALATALDMNPQELANLVELEQMLNGEKRLVASDEQANELVPRMVEAGLMDEDKGKMILANGQGFAGNITTDSTSGESVGVSGMFTVGGSNQLHAFDTVNIDTGTRESHVDSYENRDTYNTQDTTSLGDVYSYDPNMVMRNEESRDELISHLIPDALTATPDDAVHTELAKAYTGRLQAEGFSVSTNRVTTDTDSAGMDVGGGTGQTPIARGNVSATSSTMTNDNGSVNRDVAVAEFAERSKENFELAQELARGPIQRNPMNPYNSETKEELDTRVRETYEQLMEQDYGRLKEEFTVETGDTAAALTETDSASRTAARDAGLPGVR